MFTNASAEDDEMDDGSTRTRHRAERGSVTVIRVVTAARTLLRSGGLETVSIRELARTLGVSAPALYKHVRGREEIVDRLVATCLDEVAAAVAAARDTVPPAEEVAVRFLAAARGFAAWARANPAEFTLVFATPVTTFAKVTGGTGDQAGLRLGRVFVELAAQAGGRLHDVGPVPPVLAEPLAGWARSRGLPVTDGQAYTVVSAMGDLIGLVAVDVFGQLGFALPDTTAYLDRRLAELADRVAD